MDALLFAAGLGTRLRPLTDVVPKALIGVADIPMLERVARRVIDAGADRLIINVHHHPLEIEGFVRERDGFGVPVAFSRETREPLETGGGLLAAAPLLRRDSPILLHNTDVLTDFPLSALLRAHAEGGALATLAVQRRRASRYLLFDERGLFGRRDERTGEEERARPPVSEAVAFGFSGVHVIEPSLLARIEERGVFSIFRTYLRLAGAGEVMAAHDIGDAQWIDIGTPERLEQAARVAARRRPE